jgi:hypothetical protein
MYTTRSISALRCAGFSLAHILVVVIRVEKKTEKAWWLLLLRSVPINCRDLRLTSPRAVKDPENAFTGKKCRTGYATCCAMQADRWTSGILSGGLHHPVRASRARASCSQRASASAREGERILVDG